MKQLCPNLKKREREKEFQESRSRVLTEAQGPPDPGALRDAGTFTLHAHEASGAGMLPCRTPDMLNKKQITRDFLGGPGAQTPSSQCTGPGFDSWSGKLCPHAATNKSHAKSATKLRILHARDEDLVQQRDRRFEK